MHMPLHQEGIEVASHRYGADGAKRARRQKLRKIRAWRLENRPRSLPEPLKIELGIIIESPDASKSAQDAFLSRPRDGQERPKVAQERPRRFQDEPGRFPNLFKNKPGELQDPF